MTGRSEPSPLHAFLAAVALLPLLAGGCAPASSPGGGAVSGAGAAALADCLPAVAAGFYRGATRSVVPGGGREVGYSTEAGRATAAAAARATARRPARLRREPRRRPDDAGRRSAHLDGRMMTPPAADPMRIFDPGEQQAIVPRDLWDRVHTTLQVSPRVRANQSRAQTPALLRGLIFGVDGRALSPTQCRKNGRLYCYCVARREADDQADRAVGAPGGTAGRRWLRAGRGRGKDGRGGEQRKKRSRRFMDGCLQAGRRPPLRSCVGPRRCRIEEDGSTRRVEDPETR